MDAVTELQDGVGLTQACEALGVPRSSFYRLQRPQSQPSAPRPRPIHPRALSSEEQTAVRDQLGSERFADCAPRTVYATLLDEGVYLCHWRTMYRLLQADSASRERRAHRRQPHYARPELLATAPRQVWSWDITKLRGPKPGIWYNLYLILDIFSRAVVGWRIAASEDARLAEQLIAEACEREGIGRDQRTLHADRGAPMTSGTVAELLVELGVAKSHSRPTVSNDNPYAEAQFKTLKYGPTFPDRFADQAAATQWAAGFIVWYNTEHRHSGIGLLTPQVVHQGESERVVAARQETLERAAAAHPERFVAGVPRPPQVPTEVWINPPLTASKPASQADQPVLSIP